MRENLLHAELEAQTGIAERTLAEFIVDVAKGAKNVDGFKKVYHQMLNGSLGCYSSPSTCNQTMQTCVQHAVAHAAMLLVS